MSNRITIKQLSNMHVVRAAGAVLGESAAVLELTEADYPPVIYFPRDDIAMAFLDASPTTSHCPHKGDASYYSIQAKSGVIKDAAWSYESPHSGVEELRDHLAFYPDKVTVEAL